MTGAEFISKVGAMGSDHGVQGIEVVEGDIVLRGFTHNTLNKMHDKDHCPSVKTKYSNNPANHQETDDEYLARKQRQLDFYLDKITNHELGYHFAFLQEVDLFFSKEPVCVELCERFKSTLGILGWNLTQTLDERTGKPMVTLYNQARLELTSSRGVFKDNLGKKNTGLESTFIHKPTGQNITLTNLHLDYNKAGHTYSDEISAYLAKKTSEGHISILGGDTNHPRQQLVGAIGSTEFATSFDEDKDTGELSLQYRLDRSMMSAIDSFFVAPSREVNVISAMPMDCTIFTPSFDIMPLPSEYMKRCVFASPAQDAFSISVASPTCSSSSAFPIPTSYTPSYSDSRGSCSSSHVSPSAPASSRPSNADLLTAAQFMTTELTQGKKPKVRYDNGHFIIALHHDNEANKQLANTTLSKLSDALFSQLNIQRSPTRKIRKEIEGAVIQGKDYRIIKLTDDEAATLINHYKTSVARRFRVA